MRVVSQVYYSFEENLVSIRSVVPVLKKISLQSGSQILDFSIFSLSAAKINQDVLSNYNQSSISRFTNTYFILPVPTEYLYTLSAGLCVRQNPVHCTTGEYSGIYNSKANSL